MKQDISISKRVYILINFSCQYPDHQLSGKIQQTDAANNIHGNDGASCDVNNTQHQQPLGSHRSSPRLRYTVAAVERQQMGGRRRSTDENEDIDHRGQTSGYMCRTHRRMDGSKSAMIESRDSVDRCSVLRYAGIDSLHRCWRPFLMMLHIIQSCVEMDSIGELKYIHSMCGLFCYSVKV